MSKEIQDKVEDAKQFLNGCVSFILLIAIASFFFSGKSDKKRNNESKKEKQKTTQPITHAPTPTTTQTPNYSVELMGQAWASAQGITIQNTNTFHWIKPQICINGGLVASGYNLSYDYIKQLHHIRAGDSASIPWAAFSDSDGRRFDYSTTLPKHITIHATTSTNPGDQGDGAIVNIRCQ